MPLDKLRNQERSATVSLKIRKIQKTKAKTLKRSKALWIKDILSDDINRQLAGTSQVRKLIDTTLTKHRPVSRHWTLVHIRRSVLVPALRSLRSRFFEFLRNEESWQLQVEAAWVITDIENAEMGPVPFVAPVFQKLFANEESLEVLVAGILSNHRLPQSLATKRFRTLLSINKKLDLCKAMKFRVILQFAQFIKMPYVLPDLKDDSAWILVLIFSLNLARIFDVDEYELVVEVVLKLLDFPDESLCEKALLVVRQIATADCDCLLDHGALTPLLKKLKEANNNFPMQREATRILSEIFKSESDLPSEQVTSAVYSLLELLHSDDDEVLTNVCCALSYRIDGIHGIIQHHNHVSLIYDRLVGLLRHESCSVIIPVLKIVVGIVKGDASWYCKFNPADLGCLLTLLDNHNEDGDVVNDICRIICGVVRCGNMEDVLVAGFMNKLVNLIQTSRVTEVNDAAVETVNIAIAIGNDALIKYLMDISCVEVLCDVIASCSCEAYMKESFESLEKILEFGAPSIDYARQIEKKIKSIPTCGWSWPRQVQFYCGEFLQKLDKYLEGISG